MAPCAGGTPGRSLREGAEVSGDDSASPRSSVLTDFAAVPERVMRDTELNAHRNIVQKNGAPEKGAIMKTSFTTGSGSRRREDRG